MSREDNIQVFNDTETMCKTNINLMMSIAASKNRQVIILEDDDPDCSRAKKYDSNAKVIVSPKKTFEAASAYVGQKTAVLNFASASHPGGGVVRGASAQEESLCRCSSLYFCLNTQKTLDGFYNPHREAKDPIHNDDIIFTPDVTVFKTDTDIPEMMPESDWYNVDVITCAAPNLKAYYSNLLLPPDLAGIMEVSDEELMAIHEKRLRRILDVARSNGVEVIILGAFGCGAFKNDPEVVAQAAKNVLKDYLNSFRVIEYAVYSSKTNNYHIFEKALKPLMG